jgi:hypothetical protein
MKINTTVLAFASGVALTALLHVGGLWANDKRWESEMVNHGWGYWKWNIYDKMDWDGNQPLEFHWNDQPQTNNRTNWLEI